MSNMVKAKLESKAPITYSTDKGFVTIKASDGLVDVPENIYNKYKHKFVSNESKNVSNENVEEAVKKAVTDATKNLYTKDQLDEAIKEATAGLMTVEAFLEIAKGIDKINNKDNVIEAIEIALKA